MEQRKDAPEWVFYEGPPTANNKPGIHHVEPRTFKDIFCRFQTMRGHYVSRKAGWDCHGLPVEVEVEKELGIKHKRQIEEEVGIEEFVKRCRESVKRYVVEFERLTERIAFWVDMPEAYWTLNATYIESVWWLLRQIWDKGLLEEDFKVVPYCPRCETALSNNEQHMIGAYKTVVDPSVYVRFPLEEEPDTSLLIWTTTPWTLLSNVTVAVGPDLTYVKVADPTAEGHHLIVARERVEALFGAGAKSLEEMSGADLVGKRYVPPFEFVPTTGDAHTIRPGDFVTTEDGTGMVHLAPYGDDDIMVIRRDGLPIVQMVDGTGSVVAGGGDFAGMWIKDADPRIVEDLDAKGRLFLSEDYEHAYPHCWRCGTPLLYFARKDWYIRTSQIRDRLQASNEATNWQPPTIKYGRFGDWLANNVDWSLSRDRYWGTPLPIWRCEEQHAHCVGSFAELAELSGRDLTDFDPHRPYVDEIKFPCPTCGKEATRVLSVIDAWFDSGSMPFAQWHYPFENEDVFERRFPADFICEAIDQTRGWFYSLLAVATLVRDENSYKNVVCHGLLVDAGGRKMSKSVGNVIDPFTVTEAQGADALRWYLLTAGTPWSPRRIGPEPIEEQMRKYLLTLWNTYSFWVLYASLEAFDITGDPVPLGRRSELDRWILAELDDTVRVVTDSLEAFDPTGGRRIDQFVDDLSNWYVRRSRRRFWRSAGEADTQAAFWTLWECLVTVAQLTAPYTPFVAEEIYTNLTGPLESAKRAELSVHMSDWPQPIDERRDDALRRRMRLVRRLVGAGRSARTDAKVRTRQPLQRALLVIPRAQLADLEGLEELVAEELNVKEVEVAKGLEELVSYTVKPSFKVLGPRFGARMKVVAQAIGAADAHALVQQLEETEKSSVDVEGETIVLSRDELDVRVEGRPGFALAQDGPYGVALDLDISPELLAEGIAREVVRGIQDLRKNSGLAVEDRIRLWMTGDTEVVRGALEAHKDFIAGEVLATEVSVGGDGPAGTYKDSILLEEGRASVALSKESVRKRDQQMEIG